MRGYCWENRRKASGKTVNQGASMEPIRTSSVVASDRKFNVPDALLQLVEDRNAAFEERVAVDRRLDALGAPIEKSHARACSRSAITSETAGCETPRLLRRLGHAAALNHC